MLDQAAKTWAQDLVADAELGDVRRNALVIRMLRRMAQRPAGCITDVFVDRAEQQAAYDFIEGGVATSRLVDSFAASAFRAADRSCFVVVDGTSLSLTDRKGRKDFGSIGPREFPTRGVKVIDALAVSRTGLPLGVAEMTFWAREPKSKLSRNTRRRAGDNETRHWVQAIERVASRARAARVRPWFVIDREGDASAILRTIARQDADYTIRVGQLERRCVGDGSVFSRMCRRPVIGRHFVDVPAREGRRARVAIMEVRVARLDLKLPDYATHSSLPFSTHVVWAREISPPRNTERLDWMLFTSAEQTTYADAIAVLDGYCLRWRIEDFHRAWKSGHCNVEETQLRKLDRVVRWATMLATVAVRAEQLKHQSREKPDAPASDLLSTNEIEALVAIRNSRPRKNEGPVRGMPTSAQVVWWIAELGGHPGNPASGPPGTKRIARGLERLLIYAEGYGAAKGAR